MAKIQTGLRIPESRYEELMKRAEQMGVSVNALMLMLMDLGLKVLDGLNVNLSVDQ